MTKPAEPVRIFFNPNCSKCRLTMSLLNENGVTPDVIEYLSTPPTVSDIEEVLGLLKLEPRELMRQFEAPYAENKLDDKSLSRDQLIQAMVDFPILIERPIVIKGNRAVIGRPPERTLELL